MRHSVETASKNYNKVFDDEKKEPEGPNVELENQIAEVKIWKRQTTWGIEGRFRALSGY